MKDKTKKVNIENIKSGAALREEKILEFWRTNKIFDKSLKQSEGKKEFVFYEGPPTANGEPGIHHLEARAFKDAIPRYKTMCGYHVRRKGGWDTHGLPVELQVEKKLGLSSKKAIEEYGIAKFNQKCKESVWKYLDVWNKFTERIGYWVDQDNPYVTYHNEYIESVWNIFQKINKQGLLYKDYKVVPWCPRCGTALSSHELAQGYEDVKDLSVYVKFKVKGQENTFILAWTTTPWTLPGNVALAVGEDIDYVKVEVPSIEEGGSLGSGRYPDGKYIIAKARLEEVIEKDYGGEVLKEFKGKDLIGLEYEPLFPYLKKKLEEKGEATDKMFKVYGAPFVNTDDGTGIVHTAVMYGQDDFVLGTEIGLPKHHLVNPEGKFIKGTGFLEGRFVKEKDGGIVGGPGKPTLDVDIIKYLTDKNLFFSKENYQHSYPHCWRCQTALIYYARDSWYIRMSSPAIKKELISQNQRINWEPGYIRDGRFGEWLREIKDWAISRERYWGTPLPVWQCVSCKKLDVIGSIKEMKEKTKKSGNKYFVMRHGEAENNVAKEYYVDDHHSAPLTKLAEEQILKSLKNFNQKVDIIISSPFLRAKQTTEIVCKQIGFSLKGVIYSKSVQEWEVGSEFEGKSMENINQYYDHDYIYTPHKEFLDGESFAQVVKRMGNYIYEIESKYKNKNILIVGHGGATRALDFIVNGFLFEDLENIGLLKELENAEIKKVEFIPLPHNENYELDLHRPYIDGVSLVCSCGSELVRTREVMDVWFDSGCVPFAQDHYPFDFAQGKPFAGKELPYPADFICEAIDQTRGWFYTLHAVGVLMGRGLAYKNVICLGHLMDASGKKMSKSIGNVIDPWLMIEKYGVDTLRLWMYSVNQPGESKNFDEKTVALLHQQVFGLLYNVLAFYTLYRDKDLEKNDRPKSKNILDIWILTRLDELTELTTKNLDSYKLLEPTRAIRDFVGDLSTWYLRRSRERIKEGDKEAKQTMYFVLKNLVKIMAPFAPFSAEDVWLKLKNEKDEESVHLSEWPKAGKYNDPEIVKNMQITRDICTAGNAERQKLNIPIRQILNVDKLEIPKGLSREYIDIIKNELNIKNITKSLTYVVTTTQKNTTGVSKIVKFNSNITPELKQEGNYRELVRALQDMRKNMGLTPNDMVVLTFETSETGKKLVQKFDSDIKKTVLASKIEFEINNGKARSNKTGSPDASTEAFSEIKIDDLVFKVKIKK